MSYEIVRGDTSPSMPVNITANGVAVDASSADSVELRWMKPDGTVTTTTLVAVAAITGEFEMQWTNGDTDQIGPHFGEVIVTTGAAVETFPSDGSKIIWWVYPQIGDDY